MKISITSSSEISTADLGKYLPSNTTEIVSLGERSADESLEEYMITQGIVFTEFIPDTEGFDSDESRNQITAILMKVDIVLVFWDGVSAQTKLVIDICKTLNVPIRVYV